MRNQIRKNGKEEKPKQAIALSYDPDEEAPRVIASGQRSGGAGSPGR